MAAHNDLGKAGEDAAVAYLLQHDYVIAERNWRFHHLEIDIIAVKGNELVFIEVKTRSADYCQEPLEAVNRTKIRRIVQAADAYLKLHRSDLSVRFDVITVISQGNHLDVEHIPEAFTPPFI